MMNVIGRLRADLPQRLLLLERFHDRFAIEHRARPERIRGQHGHGRGVVEKMPHERLLLAVAPVLGPVQSHAGVRIDEPAIDQHVEADRGDPFGDRHHADRRRRIPRHLHGAIAPAAPDVDDRASVEHDGARGPDLVLDSEVLDERVDDGPVLGRVRPGEVIRCAARLDLRAEIHGLPHGEKPGVVADEVVREAPRQSQVVVADVARSSDPERQRSG